MKPTIVQRLIFSVILSGFIMHCFSQDQPREIVIEKLNSIQTNKEKNFITNSKYLGQNGGAYVINGKYIKVDNNSFNCKFNIKNFEMLAKGPAKGNRKHVQIFFDYNFTYNKGYENEIPEDSIVYIAFCFPNDSIMINLDMLNIDNYFEYKDSKMIKVKEFETYPVDQRVLFNLKIADIIAGEYRVKFWNSDCLISEYYFTYDE